MSRSRKKTASILAGALFLLTIPTAVSASPSSGGGGDVDADASSLWTRVTLHTSESRRAVRFNGTVEAADECVSGRKVVLFRATRRGDELIQKTQTGSWGNYNLKLHGVKEGRYFVKAPRAVVSDAYGGLLECRGDMSPTVRI